MRDCNNIRGGLSSCIRSSSFNSSWVKSRNGALGLQMILWVHIPDSRALLRGVVRSVWGALASNMGSSSSGSKIIWSSQFDNRTRSKERSCRGSDTGTPVFSRSYLKSLVSSPLVYADEARTSRACRRSSSTLPEATTCSTRLLSTRLSVSPTMASRRLLGASFFFEYTVSTKHV